MDFQNIVSFILFAAFMAFRYYIKNKSKDEAKAPSNTENPYNKKEGKQGNLGEDAKEKSTSSFEDFFKELEKELNPEAAIPEPVVAETKSPSMETFSEQQSEMQRIAEAEYQKTLSKYSEPNNQTKTKAKAKPIQSNKKSKLAGFNPRQAFMYKELLERKHFKI